MLLIGLCLLTQPLNAMDAWQKPAQPPGSTSLQAVIPDPLNAGKLIVASQGEIFSGTQNGPWEKLDARQAPKSVRRMFSFVSMPESLFLISEEGGFECSFKSRECSKFLRASGTASPAPLSMAVDPADKDHWLVGTEKGLMESDDRGRTWFPFSGFRSDPVSLLQFTEEGLFVGAGPGLFFSTDRAHFRKVFSVSAVEIENEKTPEDNFSEESLASGPAGFYHLISLPEKKSLWLAGSGGVFKSMDSGLSWKSLPASGLQTAEVRHLVYSEKTRQVFAGTSHGIFVFEPERNAWKKIYAGLETESVLGMALAREDRRETLVTITPAGFFFYPVFPDHIEPAASGGVPELFQSLVRLEPTAWQVQRQSVHYANVKNGKIKRWQAESRLAAILPSFSFGKDFDKGNSIDIDRGGTNDADRYILGPDDINRGWDINVSWDLGDFIYSSDQTSIDSREKLMVELRNDILAEVIRIYYERRRLQMDLAFNPPASAQEHYEKLLRIDEMTALLDGFTNHFFSKKLAEMYRRNPELEKLWEFVEPGRG